MKIGSTNGIVQIVSEMFPKWRSVNTDLMLSLQLIFNEAVCLQRFDFALLAFEPYD